MAIVQISQIQIRRGLNQDVPNLASGEMGWSLDTRQLYIGNGTLEEGAPTTGRTEILTEHSNFLGFLGSYVFAGSESGYTSQTGVSAISPINRSIQNVLDEQVSVRDFGAVGNGTTDDTAALNRAIQQIYKSTLNGVHINVQRTIKIPAGNYKVTGPLLIPPHCTLVGDGKDNTVILGTGTIFTTCDNAFLTGGSMNASNLPKSISISNLGITTSGSTYLAVVDSATDFIFDQVKFTGGTYGISIANSKTAPSYIKIYDCVFVGQSTAALYNPGGSGLIERTNYYSANWVVMSGAGTAFTTTLSTGAGVVEYEIFTGSGAYRLGQLKYNNNGSGCSWDDEYTEPASSINANLFANSTGTLTCTVSTASTVKYNIKQYV